jgi:hypothetical protein
MDRTPLISIELPIYFLAPKKKPLLLGFNQVVPLHPYTRNNIKFNTLIADKVISEDRYDGKYTVEYALWYSHKRIDPSNVVGIIEKFTLDGLQECGALLNDNVNCHCGSVYRLGGHDKDNPRMEVKVYRAE